MGVDPLNYLARIQKRIISRGYKRGLKINYIICIIILILLHIDGLYTIILGRLPTDIQIPISSTTLENIVLMYIPIWIHPYLVIWIIMTIYFSIKPVNNDSHLVGVKDPKCYICKSPMNSTLECSNPKCKKKFH